MNKELCHNMSIFFAPLSNADNLLILSALLNEKYVKKTRYLTRGKINRIVGRTIRQSHYDELCAAGLIYSSSIGVYELGAEIEYYDKVLEPLIKRRKKKINYYGEFDGPFHIEVINTKVYKVVTNRGKVHSIHLTPKEAKREVKRLLEEKKEEYTNKEIMKKDDLLIQF